MKTALKIGLTGGIASGKSLVAARFAALGVPVIDADRVARELVEPNQPAYRAILDEFGASVLAPNRSLDRRHLRSLVFSDPDRRRRLEAILHPLVYRRMESRAREVLAPYLVLVVPLLVETGYSGFCDRTLVVDAPPELQLRRLLQRDAIDEAQARAMIAAQADRETRRVAADDLIDNSGDIDHLLAQTDRFHRIYLEMAKAQDPA